MKQRLTNSERMDLKLLSGKEPQKVKINGGKQFFT